MTVPGFIICRELESKSAADYENTPVGLLPNEQ
jgi:hypothetical protein